MNRRQFFKTLAATAAGVVAVGVAPAAEVVGKETIEIRFKPNPAQKLIVGQWDGYYADHNDNIDATFMTKFDKAVKNHKFNYPFRNRHENQNPKTSRGAHPLHRSQGQHQTQSRCQRRLHRNPSSRAVS